MITDKTVELDILGYVRCSAKRVEDVPSEGVPGTLILNEWLAPALEGFEPGQFIYVIVLLHKSDPTVLTSSPNTPQQRGTFTIRSSDRPNRIGMTLTRIEQIQGCKIDVNWIDFSDGTPILDIKKYSTRWECVFSAPNDDRRHFEQQIPKQVLATVLARPIRNFAGFNAPEVNLLASAGAELIQTYNVFLLDPFLRVHVKGTGSLIDAVQGLTKASFGNNRLTIEHETNRKFGGTVEINLNHKRHWILEITKEGYLLQLTSSNG